jgi:hypothetical protein
VQVLHVEDPENVWVRRLQDKSYFFQLDEEIQEYCRYTKILVYCLRNQRRGTSITGFAKSGSRP